MGEEIIPSNYYEEEKVATNGFRNLDIDSDG